MRRTRTHLRSGQAIVTTKDRWREVAGDDRGLPDTVRLARRTANDYLGL